MIKLYQEIENSPVNLAVLCDFLRDAHQSFHHDHWILLSACNLAFEFLQAEHDTLAPELLVDAEKLLREDIACWRRVDKPSDMRAEKNYLLGVVLFKLGRHKDAAEALCASLEEMKIMVPLNSPLIRSIFHLLREVIGQV